MRLQAAGVGALHFLPDPVHAARVHGVVSERPFFKQVLEMAAVERLVENRGQVGLHLWAFAISDGLDQQIAQ